MRVVRRVRRRREVGLLRVERCVGGGGGEAARGEDRGSAERRRRRV